MKKVSKNVKNAAKKAAGITETRATVGACRCGGDVLWARLGRHMRAVCMRCGAVQP